VAAVPAGAVLVPSDGQETRTFATVCGPPLALDHPTALGRLTVAATLIREMAPTSRPDQTAPPRHLPEREASGTSAATSLDPPRVQMVRFGGSQTRPASAQWCVSSPTMTQCGEGLPRMMPNG